MKASVRLCVIALLYHQSLDALVRSKELELEQAAEAYRNLQWLKQKSEEKEKTALREKDTIVQQLQAALQVRSQETQVTDKNANYKGLQSAAVWPNRCFQFDFCKQNRFADRGPRGGFLSYVHVQDLTAALVARVQAGPSGVMEELKARLALKEKLFQELLSDHSRQTDEHQAQVQDLLSTLSSKDQYLQVCSGVKGRMSS